jgi:hypothetical protein
MSAGGGEVLAPVPADRVQRLAAPPTFSIMIPAYEAASTVAQAVESALAQVHPAHEVIVIDDGSADDLDGALCPFGDRIELVRKSNGGAASARNAGVEAASGEFVAVLDADDRFHPRRLEVLAELASSRPDLDLVTTDAGFVVEGEQVSSFARENRFEVEDQRTAILRSCFVGGWPAVRASRVREAGGFDETLRVGHDWDCWVRLILAGSQAGMVDLPYYCYAVHGGGLTGGRVESLWDRVKLLEKAVANPDLRPEERPVAKSELRRRRSEAVLEEAQTGEGPSRRRLLRLATLPGIGPRTRAAVALAVASPRLAGRLLHRRQAPEARLADRD